MITAAQLEFIRQRVAVAINFRNGYGDGAQSATDGLASIIELATETLPRIIAELDRLYEQRAALLRELDHARQDVSKRKAAAPETNGAAGGGNDR
jgi:hypothetical protein